MKEYIIKVDDEKPDIMGNMPLVEKAKELVRCKDCRMNNQCSIQFKFADADNPGDWFCANGHRS